MLGSILGMLIALILVFLSEPMYDAKATLRIGAFGIRIEEKPENVEKTSKLFIEDPQRLIQILRSRYRVREAKTRQLDLPYLYAVGDGTTQDIIHLSARGSSPEDAEKFLQSILDWVNKRHMSRYEKVIEQFEGQSEFLKSIVSQATRVESYLASNDPGSIAKLKSIEGSHLHHDVMLYIMRVVSLTELATNIMYREQTEIVSTPKSSGKKISPKPLLYMITGIIVGLFSSIALVGVFREIELLLKPYRKSD